MSKELAERSPEEIIQEREALRIANALDEAKQRLVELERHLDERYEQLIGLIRLEIRKVPDRLRQSEFKNGRIGEAYVKHVMVTRRFRKPYAEVETEDRAYWSVGNGDSFTYISASASFYKKDYVEDEGRILTDKDGDQLPPCLLTQRFDEVVPPHRPSLNIDCFEDLLQDLRNLGT